MNKKEITIKNIENCGYRVGKSVKGKGVELFKYDHLVVGLYINPTSEKSIKEAKKETNKYNLNQLYVKNIWIYENGKKKHFKFEDAKISQKIFNVKKLIDTKFKNVVEIDIYATYLEIIRYFPISKYSASLNDQKIMIENLLKSEGYSICNNMRLSKEPYFTYLEHLDNVMTFSSCADEEYWNGDYNLIHGDPICQDIDDCEYFNGRMSYVNDFILEDYWQDIYFLKEYLNELDPKNEICVYSRKGKDWYIGYTYNEEEVSICYIDEDGDEDIENMYAVTYEKNQKLINKIIKALEREKKSLEIKSCICNELKISNECCNDFTSNDNLFNLEIIDKNFDKDRYDAANKIEEYINWNNITDITTTVKDAYKKLINNIFKSNS